jgi:hypothetical protein
MREWILFIDVHQKKLYKYDNGKALLPFTLWMPWDNQIGLELPQLRRLSHDWSISTAFVSREGIKNDTNI